MIDSNDSDAQEGGEEGGKILDFKAPLVAAAESSEKSISETLAGITALVREVYNYVFSKNDVQVSEVSSLIKIEARANAIKVLRDSNSKVLVNGDACELDDLFKNTIKILEENVRHFKIQIPWAAALKLGNLFMEGDYHLDVFVEAYFVEMLGRLVKTRVDNGHNVELSLEYGDDVCDEDGIPKSRESYDVCVRNLNVGLEEVPIPFAVGK